LRIIERNTFNVQGDLRFYGSQEMFKNEGVISFFNSIMVNRGAKDHNEAAIMTRRFVKQDHSGKFYISFEKDFIDQLTIADQLSRPYEGIDSFRFFDNQSGMPKQKTGIQFIDSDDMNRNRNFAQEFKRDVLNNGKGIGVVGEAHISDMYIALSNLDSTLQIMDHTKQGIGYRFWQTMPGKKQVVPIQTLLEKEGISAVSVSNTSRLDSFTTIGVDRPLAIPVKGSPLEQFNVYEGNVGYTDKEEIIWPYTTFHPIDWFVFKSL
jgi:hypothetical protein